MKRIFHIITTINRGGAENQLLTLARQQVKEGYLVEIAYLKDAPALLADFESVGAKVHDFLVGKSPIVQLILLRKYLRNGKRIVHAHLPRAQLLAALAGTSNPIVSSRHDAEPFFHDVPKLVSRLLALLVDFRSSKQIAISTVVKDGMVERKEVFKNSEIAVIHYGFESLPLNTSLDPFPDNFEEISKRKTIVGTAGRLVHQKDYPTLLSGFAQFHAIQPESVLVIAGGGPLRNELEKQCIDLGIEQFVFWLGGISSLEPFYRKLDVFVLASKTEGFGLVLLEAMSYEIPIVASNSTAIPEVLGAKCGMLFSVGDTAGLCNSLLNMTKAVNLEKHSKYSGQRILDFKPEIMSRRISEIYELAAAN